MCMDAHIVVIHVLEACRWAVHRLFKRRPEKIVARGSVHRSSTGTCAPVQASGV
jgi:hypothetical protein